MKITPVNLFVSLLGIVGMVGTLLFFILKPEAPVEQGAATQSSGLSQDTVIAHRPSDPASSEEVTVVQSNVVEEEHSHGAAATTLPEDPWTVELHKAYVPDRSKIDLQVLAEFEAWIKDYNQDPSSVSISEGIALAKARMESLREFAKLDPDKAWKRMISQTDRDTLPAEVLQEMETPLEAPGNWQEYAVAYDPVLPTGGYYKVTLQGRDEPLYALPVGNMHRATPPLDLPLNGYDLDGIALFNGEPPRKLEGGDRIPDGATVRSIDPVSMKTLDIGNAEADGVLGAGQIAWFDGESVTFFRSEHTWQMFVTSPVE